MRPIHQNLSKGFTLLEITIIVIIIGILSTLAINKFDNITIKARESVIKHLGKSLGKAVEQYFFYNPSETELRINRESSGEILNSDTGELLIFLNQDYNIHLNTANKVKYNSNNSDYYYALSASADLDSKPYRSPR